MRYGGRETASHLRLYRTLQRQPSIAYLVTHFSVSMSADQICGKRWYSAKLTSRSICACTTYDQALGEALRSLTNLQALAIRCDLCASTTHGHAYLFQLDAPQLRNFTFRCHGTPIPIGKDAFSYDQTLVLQVPFMPNVTALWLECDLSRICDEWLDSYDYMIEQENLLPNLKIMSHDGLQFSRDLLATRPIQRLCIDEFNKNLYDPSFLHDLIKRSPGVLTHLLTIDIPQWLLNAKEQDLNPYRNLKFIGTIIIFPSMVLLLQTRTT